MGNPRVRNPSGGKVSDSKRDIWRAASKKLIYNFGYREIFKGKNVFFSELLLDRYM
jgi:hypothetical protein